MYRQVVLRATTNAQRRCLPATGCRHFSLGTKDKSPTSLRFLQRSSHARSPPDIHTTLQAFFSTTKTMSDDPTNSIPVTSGDTVSECSGSQTSTSETSPLNGANQVENRNGQESDHTSKLDENDSLTPPMNSLSQNTTTSSLQSTEENRTIPRLARPLASNIGNMRRASEQPIQIPLSMKRHPKTWEDHLCRQGVPVISSPWMHVEGLPKIKELIENVQEAIKEELDRGIVDLRASFVPHAKAPTLTEANIMRTKGAKSNRYIKEARLVLSSNASPSGWNIRLANKSIAQALLARQQRGTPLLISSELIELKEIISQKKIPPPKKQTSSAKKPKSPREKNKKVSAPVKQPKTWGDYLAGSKVRVTSEPWIHIKDISPITSLEAMVEAVEEAIDEELEKGIVDLDQPFVPRIPAPRIDPLDPAFADERSPYRYIREARFTLSPFARPNGWYVRLANRSLAQALLMRFRQGNILHIAGKRTLIHEYPAPLAKGKLDFEGHVPTISDATLRIENCPDNLDKVILLNFFTRFDLSTTNETITPWSGVTPDGKVASSQTFVVQFEDPAWARAALREQQGSNLSGSPVRLIQYPRQLIPNQ